MYDYLKDHAVKNVWCNPEQDNQIILAAKRVTKREGEMISFPLMKRRVDLPTTDRRYHVFQIGQVHPVVLGLLPRQPHWLGETWKSFADAVETLTLFADLYNDAGIHVPLHRAFYMYTKDRALIFAVDETSKSAVDFNNEQLYLRLYTNAYYESSQASSLAYQTRVFGMVIYNNNDLLTAQAKAVALKALPGATLCFVNGRLVDAIDFMTVKIGQVVECLYDASVKSVVDLPVYDLQTFTSDLDHNVKYLLHPPGRSDVIDYVDDVDVYVLAKSGERFIGHYLHRNQGDTLRMVTHRDYSLRVEVFETIAQALTESLNSDPGGLRSFHIRLYIRNSGMIRPLTHDHQRVFEMYKLNDAQVVQAMVGVDSSMPYWRAPALEKSAYTELMRAKYVDIDIDLIERSYGYNSITRIIGETPIKTRPFNASQIVDLAAAYVYRSTSFEYDADGKLLGWYPHLNGTVYFPQHPETRMVESTRGTGSRAPSVVEGQDHLLLPDDYSYRVYMCYLIGGVPSREWIDITGSDLYVVEGNHLVWQNLESDQWLQVRSDEAFICYDLQLPMVAGTLYFDLAEQIGDQLRMMEIPTGKIDLWLNGKALVPKLDFFVAFPRVYIVNKEHLLQPAKTEVQTVTVRMTGFADAMLKMQDPEDYGFIEHGVLSNNARFDIRDDKVLRITVRGNTKHRSELLFSEENQGVSIVNALNGSPYQVCDVTVPLHEFGEEETYLLRMKSHEVDVAVEDYMSLKLPQPERNAVSAIASRYMLVSPFFCHIANDLANRDFDMPALERVLSDSDVLALCQPYESLLTYDPINPQNNIDHRYVVIHPTERLEPIGLDLYSYRFMQRVVALYGRNLISLSPHLVVSLGGN